MKKTKMYKYGIYFFALLFVGIVTYMYFSKESVYLETEYTYINDGWTASKSLDYEDVNISELVFHQVKRGQEILFENTIPEFDYLTPALGFYTIHSAVQVTIDGEIIYDYGFDRADVPNKLIGFGYHLVSLPHDCSGKQISIYLKVTEDNAFTNFEAPWICNGTEFTKNFIIQRKLPLVIIIFLILMGVILFILSLVFSINNKDFYKLACIGAFSSIIGLWSLCNYDLIFIFTYNPLIKTYMEFVSLYCCTIPLILYFWDDIKLKKKNWVSLWYYILFICQVIFTVMAFILQGLLQVSMPRVLMIQHILMAVLATYLITTCIIDLISKTYEHIALSFGIAILFIIGMADMIRFNIQKYLVAFQGHNYTSLICLGTLIFIICQLIDYYQGIERDLIKLAQTQTLEKWAYLDELTELYNRRKCEQELDEIEEKKEPCGIFSFDLNNLKTVNDSLGHEKGDEMLRIFAEVLKRAFADEPNVLIARTGGDEFLAIYHNPAENVKKHYIEKINQLLKEESTKLNYRVSVAIGYAYLGDYSSEDIKSTLRKADKRMYKYKALMKNTNQQQK